MNRFAETVLNGHPDKFCDLVADAILREAGLQDAGTYGQVEVSVWSDELFLTGALVAKSALSINMQSITQKTGTAIGYTMGNHIDATRYKIHDAVCRIQDDPRKWSGFSNDQCIVTGYAGYDANTRYLPPEQFAAWHFREKLILDLQNGLLKGHGPDGKILLTMQEDAEGWKIDTLLCTLQQLPGVPFTAFTRLVQLTLSAIYQQMQQADNRWLVPWADIRLLINPNGPFFQAGSDGDNGQTGRKLVMDYYGPRIPIGGGALYGKALTHIDRLTAYAARRYALSLVQQGATEARVQVCFAPGLPDPLLVDIQSPIRPREDPKTYFNFENMQRFVQPADLHYHLPAGAGFYNHALSHAQPSLPVVSIKPL